MEHIDENEKKVLQDDDKLHAYDPVVPINMIRPPRNQAPPTTTNGK